MKDCIKTDAAIVYYLNELERIKVIKFEDRLGKIRVYKLCEDAKRREERLAEIKIINLYPIEQRNSMDTQKNIHISLYGIDKNFFNKEDQKIMEKECDKLNSIISNLYNLKLKSWNKEIEILTNRWMAKTKSKKLKNALKERYLHPFWVFFIPIFLKYLDYSKVPTIKEFYRWFGISIENKKIVDFNKKLLTKRMPSFEEILNKAEFNENYKVTNDNEDIGIFIQHFSEFLGFYEAAKKEDPLSLSELKETIDFLWEYFQITKKWLPAQPTIFATHSSLRHPLLGFIMD